MAYIIIALDREGAAEERAKRRIPHLNFIGSRQNQVIFGGPILTESEEMVGSLMILDFSNRQALDAHLAEDPYFASGLYEAVIIRKTRKIVPEDHPGDLAEEIERQKSAS